MAHVMTVSLEGSMCYTVSMPFKRKDAINLKTSGGMVKGKVMGVSGTRHYHSITLAQRHSVDWLMKTGPDLLLHGDCEGVDEMFHLVARRLNVPVHIFPPIIDRYRAFCQGAEKVYPCDTYLARNAHIVAEADVLVAIPEGREKDYPRSGTWATVRRARKHGIPIYIIAQDGGIYPDAPS